MNFFFAICDYYLATLFAFCEYFLRAALIGTLNGLFVLSWTLHTGSFYLKKPRKTLHKKGDKGMIYNVCWLENNVIQRVFFRSFGCAQFFIYRLQRNSDCQNIALEETELKAA